MTRANQISERAYLTNGRAIGGSAIPDYVINHWPANEGSGSTLLDKLGGGDISLTFSTWRDDTAFAGGTAPDYDGTNDNGNTTAQVGEQAWSVRAIREDNGDRYDNVFGHGSDPALAYDSQEGRWIVFNSNGKPNVTDSPTAVERIIFVGGDGSSTYLYVYDKDGNLVGSNSTSQGGIIFDSSTFTVGERGDGANYWDGVIDQIMRYNQWLDSTQRSEILNNYYL